MPRTKLVNGVVVNFTAEEETARDIIDQAHQDNLINIKLEELRNKRNQLLADSDWEVTMAKEKGTNLSSAFKTWRQDLRDITEGLTTVEEVEGVVFPEKP